MIGEGKVLKRIRRAVDLICKGTMTRGQVAAALQEEFGVSRAVAWKTVKTAREDYLTAWDKEADIKVLVGETIAKATKHYERCCTSEQHSAGLATLKWIAELEGVDGAVTRVEVSGKVEHDGSVSISADQVDSMRSLFGLPPKKDRADGDDGSGDDGEC